MAKLPLKVYRAMARKVCHREGVLEVRKEAPVYRVPQWKGAFVEAWIWVADARVNGDPLSRL